MLFRSLRGSGRRAIIAPFFQSGPGLSIDGLSLWNLRRGSFDNSRVRLTIPEVLISVDEPFTGLVDEESLERMARAGLDVALETPDAAQVGLLITGDDTVRRLNGQYRGLDEVTDVLSFSANHQGHWEGEDDGPDDPGDIQFIWPPDEPEPLGEVIISYPQTQRQAEERGVSLEQELALLVIHGVLHLTGHDHVEPEETAAMQAKERTALQSLRTEEFLSP